VANPFGVPSEHLRLRRIQLKADLAEAGYKLLRDLEDDVGRTEEGDVVNLREGGSEILVLDGFVILFCVLSDETVDLLPGPTEDGIDCETECTSLERVVYNKNLKTIGDGAFGLCPLLEDVQLASSSTSFGINPFGACDRMIEIATAAGFPSTTFVTSPKDGKSRNMGV